MPAHFSGTSREVLPSDGNNGKYWFSSYDQLIPKSSSIHLTHTQIYVGSVDRILSIVMFFWFTILNWCFRFIKMPQVLCFFLLVITVGIKDTTHTYCTYMYVYPKLQWYIYETWQLALYFQVRSPLSAHFISMDRYRSSAHFANFQVRSSLYRSRKNQWFALGKER